MGYVVLCVWRLAVPVITQPEGGGKGCGKCCWLRVVIEPEDDVPAEMTEPYEGDGVPEIVMKRSPVDMYCVAFDRKTRLCTIYERRPAMCREFDCGNDLCLQAIYRADNGLRPIDLPDLEFVRE